MNYFKGSWTDEGSYLVMLDETKASVSGCQMPSFWFIVQCYSSYGCGISTVRISKLFSN